MMGREGASVRPRDRALRVYWKGEEVVGALVYGLRHQGMRPPVDASAAWPEGTECGSPSRLHGECWEIDLWTIRPPRIPTGNEWVSLLQRTLEGLAEAGYVVGWFAPEGDFVDPPDLFDPEMMGEGIYAAFSRPTGFLCRDAGVGGLRPLASEDLANLRSVAQGVWVACDNGNQSMR